MQCLKCGKNLDDQTEICPNCGKHQPDAAPVKKTGLKSTFSSISLIFLVIGLCITPLLLVLVAVLATVGIITEASVLDVIFQIGKISLVTAGPPLLISLIFYILSK